VPSVSLSVQRSASEKDGAPRFEEHEVEVAEKASVLDALFALQRGPCPDLAFRYSCRVGMCGSCAMVVNGREQLICSVLIESVGRRLRIQPLRNLPVVRDLAVDMTPFFAAYKRVLPQFVPRDDLDANHFFLMPHDSQAWQNLNHQPQCIDCAACFSACSLVTLHPRYVGPMALHRALSLLVDPRDKAKAARLAVVAGENGAFGCHTLGNCRDACPRGISPTHSISRLKRLALAGWFGNFLGRFFKA